MPVSVPSLGYASVTLSLVDLSPRAIPGSVALAVTSDEGHLLTPDNDPGIASETSGTQETSPPASIVSSLALARGFYGVNLSLPAVGANKIVVTATAADARTQTAQIVVHEALGSRHVVVLFNGASVNRFTRARLTATFVRAGRSIPSVIEISAQPRVASIRYAPEMPAAYAPLVVTTTQNHKLDTSESGLGQTCVVTDSCEPRPPIDDNQMLVASGDTLFVSRIDGSDPSFYPLGTATLRPAISGVSLLSATSAPPATNGNPVIFFTDAACALCQNSTATGLMALDFRQPPYVAQPLIMHASRTTFNEGGAGPRGLAIDTIGAPAVPPTIYVAARNAIYRYRVSFDGPRVSQTLVGPVLVAGSGSLVGPEPLRDGVGTVARFDFGMSPTVGLAFDSTTARPRFLFVADPGHAAVRRIDLSNNAVTTVAGLPGAPAGIAVNEQSGVIITSVPANHAIYTLEGRTVHLYAGAPSRDGAEDGFGLAPYPLQFSDECLLGSGLPAVRYSGLPLGANSPLPMRAAAFRSPYGLTIDPQNGMLLVADRAAGLVRSVR